MTLHGVSVVIPLFNKKKYLRKTLESVLAQDYENFEVIVVDDGSTDGSYELVENEFKKSVRLIKQRNAGPGPARNRGVNEARFDLIAFIDADDIWCEKHLSELVKLYENDPTAGLYSTKGKKLAGIEADFFTPKYSGSWRYVDYVSELAAQTVIIHTSSVMLSKVDFLSVGGFRDFRPGQDVDLWLRLALQFPVVQSDSVTSCHRLDTGGIMDQSDIFGLKDSGSLPQCIGQVSPLFGAMTEIRDRFDCRSDDYLRVNYLINRRLLSMIRVLLVNGRQDKARNLSKLFSHPYSLSLFSYRLFLMFPFGFAGKFVNAFRRVKRVFSGD